MSQPAGTGVKQVRIEGLLPQQLFQIQSKAALEGLEAGDLIQGRVAALQNGLLVISLLDGSSFSASVPEGFEVYPGTMLTLQIGEPSGDQLTARIVRMEFPPRQEVVNNAQGPGIPGLLEKFGAKATEALVSKVIGLVDENPGLGIEKAAFLAANSMEQDRNMVLTALKLTDREFDLNDNLRALGRLLGESLSEADASSLETVLRPVILELEAQGALKNLLAKFYGSGLRGEGPEGIHPDRAAESYIAGKLMEVLEDHIYGRKAMDPESLYYSLQKALQDMTSGKSPAHEGLKNDGNLMKEMLEGLAGEIARLAEKTDALFRKGAPDIKAAIDRMVEKAYIRAEDGGVDSIDLKEKAEILKKIINVASDVARLADEKAGQAIRPLVQELSNALRFFSQVSTYHVFTHVPIVVNGNHTTGQLYIMKRRSGKGKINPKQFTLFMSLRTLNLGLVETFLNASYGCVTIHFRVESPQLADFVKSHRKELHEALEKKGYKLADMRCRVFDGEPVNFLNAEDVTETILGMNARVDLRI